MNPNYDEAGVNTFRPLSVGDVVKVLRACRLPAEDVVGIGAIERVSRCEDGRPLYWVRGFLCARTERELRRWKSMADVWAEEDEERHE